ncbi:MAG: ATPase [Mesorhizobium sp.]|uniref:AAA domain-containing protein n=1 Tax=Mesorhizobium sp. TaxID=1871066 RepID=UPI000FE56CDD|nr:AAA domain-containing protein [Mesorhizobium sp.]RWH76844.1 MAG: ATPase [Mesorhizobium sp.]RWH80153.1 MAG: ATPase [Mesorhizobium sp.]RWH88768.1 MAG: ATPase [Mesorhizobium sp.]RWH95625.1 MAG: ATPase [Mesorhizobium sp.]RWI01310.1 MAG: ATPase [Mesorhizobium sp.]
MKIKAFTVDGPMPTEIPALQEIERVLPGDWLGFANVTIRHPTKARYEREVDLIIVTHDRIILVDLKHWAGKLDLVDGYWHQDGQRREKSPVEKMRGNVFLLLNVFEAESFRLGKPRVEGLVVLTHPNCDASQLGNDGRAVMRLGDFLRIHEPKRYQAAFGARSNHENNPLNAGQNKGTVTKFFSPGRIFEPRKTRFTTYEAVGKPEFTSTLYAEYLARDVEEHNATGLLRIWDFEQDDELRHSPERKDLVERERAVLMRLADLDPDLAAVTLRSRARDTEVGTRYWELFDRDRHLQRLSRFLNDKGQDLDFSDRVDLVKMLSGYVAGLHRTEIAHRDLGGHSIWIDPGRLRVVLSSFGAARFPDRRSAGHLRAKLVGAGLKLPEDVGVVDAGSAYCHDVFLLGAAAWSVLSGVPLPENDGVPDWSSVSPEDRARIPEGLAAWVGRCLEWDPAARFADGMQAHDGLLAALAGSGAAETGVMDVRAYEADIDPMLDFPVARMIDRARARIYTTEHEGETLLVKNWPERLLGDRSKNAARLIEFFGRADRLRSVASGRLPRVRVACLCQDGLFVLQDYLEGRPLDEADVTGWSAEAYRIFLLGLINLVEEVHDLRLPHGDLSPKNILVAETDAGMEARVIDFLDFSTEAAGERMTLAYAPSTDNADPYRRDRFAVGAIAAELAGRISGLPAEDLAALSKAADACREQDIPWASLRPLANALSGKAAAPSADEIKIALGLLRCEAPGPMLADDGYFHVVLNGRKAEISIVGFDCQLILAFDKETRALRSARQVEATGQTLTWVARNKAFSFHGSVEVYQARAVTTDGGVDALLARAAETDWFAEPSEAPEALPEAPVLSPMAREAPAAPAEPLPFPTVRFWQEQIKVEESLRPTLTLIDDVYADSLHDVMIAPHDSDAALDGIENGDILFYNDARIGVVVAEHTRPGSLAFRFTGVQRRLKLGDTLVLQGGQNAESLRRRALAMRRILHGETPIRDLVAYFDPSSKAQSVKMAPSVVEADLEQYGLNPDQIAAFGKLWTRGPLGLLQGPPGTGKTKFIGAFVHHALTKGGCRNVLLVSQSHEAVNTAAERIQALMREEGQDLDLLRVSNDPDKISDPLRRSHVNAIQDLYLARFEAEAKERLCMVARRLGLSRAFAADFFEIQEGPVEVARQIARLRNFKVAQDDEISLQHRIRALEDALDAQLRRFGLEDVDASAHPEEIGPVAENHLLDAHNIRDLEAVRRLQAVHVTARQWTKTLRTRSRTLEEFFAGSRRLVCGTCVGIGNPRLRLTEKTYDLVVIDEAARATSSELAVAMQSASRILLVGDHKQLPPTPEREVVRKLALSTGVLDESDILRSDFERAFGSAYGMQVSATLKRQYRMAPAIGDLVSKAFYPEMGLMTERGEPDPHYDGLPFPFDHQFTWVDTGARSGPGEVRRGTSYNNPAEAQAIVRMLETLSGCRDFLDKAIAKLKDGEPLVGVICMYAPQRDLIQDMVATSTVPRELRALIKVDTVDSYQGKENRIVIVSLVRSNERGQIGFLNTENRINVAVSRAMDRLILVGAAAMFRKSSSKLSDVLAHMEAAGRVVSGQVAKPEAA